MRWAALVAAGLALAACQTRPAAAPAEDQQAYHAALRTLARDPEAGSAALREFVARRPQSSLADDAALRLAEARVEAGDDDEALRRLVWLVRTHPEADRSDAARILLARLERARGHTAAAYRTLQEVRLSLLERDRRAEAHRLLADLAGEAGDRSARLRWLARVRADQDGAEGVERVDAELDAALAELSPADLERAARELGRAVPAGRVRLRQAELALEAGDAAEAGRFLAHASQLPLTPGDAERLTAFEARLRGGPLPGTELAPGGTPSAFPDTARAEGAVGVVLPLSGELAGAGEEALDGILLASGVLGAGTPRLRRRRASPGSLPQAECACGCATRAAFPSARRRRSASSRPIRRCSPWWAPSRRRKRWRPPRAPTPSRCPS